MRSRHALDAAAGGCADRLITEFDRALRALTGVLAAQRSSPAEAVREASLSQEEKAEAAALMRVNHAGEICAQALYQGQALTARDPSIRRTLQEAAIEEQDQIGRAHV